MAEPSSGLVDGKSADTHTLLKFMIVSNSTIISPLKEYIDNSHNGYTYFTENAKSLELFQQLNEL
jgi:hypothetical protein